MNIRLKWPFPEVALEWIFYCTRFSNVHDERENGVGPLSVSDFRCKTLRKKVT